MSYMIVHFNNNGKAQLFFCSRGYVLGLMLISERLLDNSRSLPRPMTQLSSLASQSHLHGPITNQMKNSHYDGIPRHHGDKTVPGFL